MKQSPSYEEGKVLAVMYPIAAGFGCDEEAKAGKLTYNCTREPGHDGPHVAHIYRFGPLAVLVWDGGQP